MGKSTFLQDFKAFAMKGKRHRHGCRCSYWWCVWKNRIIIGC